MQHVALDLGGRLLLRCRPGVRRLMTGTAAVLVFELVEDREDGGLEAVDVVQEAGRVLLLRGCVEGHGRTEEGRRACFVDAGLRCVV